MGTPDKTRTIFDLPTELLDKIFLLLDHKSLEVTRPLQSEYVKTVTKYATFRECFKSEECSVENIKWTIETNKEDMEWDHIQWLTHCAREDKIEVFEYLLSKKFAPVNGEVAFNGRMKQIPLCFLENDYLDEDKLARFPDYNSEVDYYQEDKFYDSDSDGEEEFLEDFPMLLEQELIESVTKPGKEEFIPILYKYYPGCFKNEYFVKVVEWCPLETLKMLHRDFGVKFWNEEAYMRAVFSFETQPFQWLYELGTIRNPEFEHNMDIAVYQGNFNLVKYFNSLGIIDKSGTAMTYNAISMKRKEILEFLIKEGYKVQDDAFDILLKCHIRHSAYVDINATEEEQMKFLEFQESSFDMLKYLYDILGIKPTPATFNLALPTNVKVLRWLHNELGLTHNLNTFKLAMFYYLDNYDCHMVNHMIDYDIINFLINEVKCYVPKQGTLNKAIKFKSKETIKLLFEKGCLPTKTSFKLALDSNRCLETLKVLHRSVGIQPESWVFNWIIKNTIKKKRDCDDCYNVIQSYAIEKLEWLRSIGLNYNHDSFKLAIHNYPLLMKWLFEIGCRPCSSFTISKSKIKRCETKTWLKEVVGCKFK